MNLNILLAFLVGLVIFIHGIENFSHQILKAAGERFRNFLRAATKNRFFAAVSGMFVTSVIQSSTAVTVMAISLVSAGVISFAQSLGIVIGANVGTTITAQLVAFKVTAYAPFFIISGFIISLFGRHFKYIGRGIFYFGLVFFGLGMIEGAVSPLKDHPAVISIFSDLSNPYFALLVGILFTAIMHSSSVGTGLVVVLASGGILTLEQGIPILLGTNIGTTITALYSSLRLNKFARRTAVAHLFFNVIGVILAWPFIGVFIGLISFIGGTSAQQMANAHTIFNVILALLFLVLLTPFRKLIEKIVKTDEEEVLISAKYLKDSLPASNSQAFSMIEKELSYFLTITFSLYEKSVSLIMRPTGKGEDIIEKYETLADLLDEKIESALLELSGRELTEKEAKKTVLLIRVSNVIEQLADTSKDLSGLPRSMEISSLSLSDAALKSINNICENIKEPFYEIQKSFPRVKKEDTPKYLKRLDDIPPAITKSYNEHIKRLKTREARGGSIFVESSSYLENAAGMLKEILILSGKYARFK